MAIQAIETRYKGYRFRSRLEARWAVFFDALGLKWEYEPEGYVLQNGECYLPDFYFPQIDMFGEVKPSNDSGALHEAVSLCEALTVATGKACLLLFGMPEHAGMFGTELIDGDIYHQSFAWSYQKYWDTEGRMYSATGEEGIFPFQFSHYDEDPVFVMARNAARAARFEHGEQGAAA